MQQTPNQLMREETDSLGPVLLPAKAMFGAQTQRAVDNFGQLREPLSQHREFLRALGEIKLAYARRNHWPQPIACAIERACDDLIHGKLDSEFPISTLQGGAGTATNMNANEVIANVALKHLGELPGHYETIHPNDHVNRGQSTNDVYPSALRIACLRLSQPLLNQIQQFSHCLHTLAESQGAVEKLGRTQLQDAVPMQAGDELRAWANAVQAAGAQLSLACDPMTQLNLGGTAIGTGINGENTAPVYQQLRHITGLKLSAKPDLIQASWDTGDWLTLAASQKRLGLCLSKIASDLRLLSSGPVGGLGEYRLPARAPGSSIMPGKVNPVIPEFINQIAFDCSGREHAIALAAEQGQLQLNAFIPLIAHHLFANFYSLTQALEYFRSHCLEALSLNPEAIAHTLQHSHAGATALVPTLGYTRVVQLLKEAKARGCTLAEIADR